MALQIPFLRNPRWVLAAILALALGLRLIAAVVAEHRAAGGFLFGDSQTYWELAAAVAHGGPYVYGSDQAHAQRMPGYPLLLAPLFVLGKGHPPIVWARLENALLATLAVWAVYGLARTLFNRQAGLAAAAIAAVYPEAIATGGFVLSEAPFSAALVAHLACWAQGEKTERIGGRRATRCAWWLAAGLLAGIAVLIRPSFLLFPWFAAVILVSRRRSSLLGSGLVLAASLVPLAPWWARNAVVYGRFVPTTLQVGASLYDGLNPEATGASDMRFVDDFRQRVPGRGPEAEIRRDVAMRTAATAWAETHPTQVLRLARTKLVRLWNIWPNEASFSTIPVRLLVLFTFVPVVFLAIISPRWTRSGGPAYWLCWLPAIYTTLLHVVFVSSLRYRGPVMLPLVVLAAATLCATHGSFRKHAAKEGCVPSSSGW